jgi:predicted XRE-type DNA-binding protein
MTSFQIGISPNRRAAARFVARVRRVLQSALIEERDLSGISQSKIANSLEVHRSVISRELNGLQDITLGRVAELAWAMGREIKFDLVRPQPVAGSNAPLAKSDAITSQKPKDPKVESSSTPDFRTQSEVVM